MAGISEYARRGEECLRLAGQVESDEARTALVNMAAAWLLMEQKIAGLLEAGVMHAKPADPARITPQSAADS